MGIWKIIKKNELVDTLLHLKGNARACVLTEPLWGIPAYLYAPFASVYMSALGLSDPMIGLVGTLFLISQVIFSILSGVLTDKLGRRDCTFYYDLVGWSVPVLLWALARDHWWFIAAALFNGSFRVTANSWNLLLVEDEESSMLVKLFTLVNIAAGLSAAAVLLSYPLVHRFGLVPTVRGMYWFAFVSMNVKFILLYMYSKETRIGKVRKEEVKDRSVWSLLGENRAVFAQMLRQPKVMWTVGLLACFLGSKALTDTFWPLLVTGKMGIAQESLAFFAAARSGIMVLCYFLLSHRVSVERFRHPLVLCFGLQILSKAMLMCMPEGAMGLLWCSVVIEALSMSMLTPLTESLQMANLEGADRSRMLALFFAMVMLITAPFSSIGGLLSKVDRALPFALALALYVAGMYIAHRIWRIKRLEQAAA